MKQFLLLALVCIATGLGAQSVVYVDADNGTPGDGSSWATAFANLNDALLAAPAGAEVWVAAGTYVTPDTASFMIEKELSLLGGFAGTETSADAADPDVNVTILSGDVLGNDPAMGYDSLAFSDNNRVLSVNDTASTSKYLVTIDGLTITNGAIAVDRAAGEPLEPFSGGGLLALGQVRVSRVTFTANRANFGAAIFCRFPTTNESVFEDITVIDNYTDGQRAIYVRDNLNVLFRDSDFQGLGDATDGSGIFRGFNTDGMTIRNCTFSNINSSISGGGVAMSRSTNTLIESCVFDGVQTQGWGGGINCFNTDITVSDCQFISNSSVRNGAALYYETGDEGTFTARVENSTFTDNSGGAFGGSTAFLAFEESSFNATFDNCTIEGGIANNNGRGAAGYVQDGGTIELLNSTITENVAQGGAFVVNGAEKVTVFKTDFVDNGNNFTVGRGALVCFLDDPNIEGLSIDSSRFEGNQIVAIGGFFSAGAATYVFGGNETMTPLKITNTQYINNATTDNASGAGVYTSRAIDLEIDNVDFLNNSSGDIGGGLHSRTFISRRDTADNGDITVFWQPFEGKITNSRFINNLSQTQGGAIGTFRAAYDISNCVFVGNAVAPSGASGGAIIYNGNSAFFNDDGSLAVIGDLALTSSLINNTFVSNVHGSVDGAVGNDIALFQTGDNVDIDTNSITVTLLNNAFLQTEQGSSIDIEAGADEGGVIEGIGIIDLISLGGNFFNNEIDPLLDPENPADITNLTIDDTDKIAALFVDVFDDEGEGVIAQLNIPDPVTDNPLINTAVVSPLVPATDLLGNPRGEAPDIGAYEADQATVSTDQPIADSGLRMSFFPNPTSDVLVIRNDDASVSDFAVMVADQQGRVLTATQFNGSANELNLSALPAGIYNLRLVINGQVYSQQVVKQ